MAIFPPGKCAQFLADGEGVKQRLGRMFVYTVAGVDDRRGDMLGEEMRRAAGAMPHDDHIHFHGQDIVYGIEQGLALCGGRPGSREVDGIGGKAFFGQLEGDAGPG